MNCVVEALLFGLVAAVEALVDFLAFGAYGELLRVAARDPDLSAQGDDGLAGQSGLHDLFLTHIVRKAFVVSRLNFLGDLGALDRGGTSAGGSVRVIAERIQGHAHVHQSNKADPLCQQIGSVR